jgi:hypothetical protein
MAIMAKYVSADTQITTKGAIYCGVNLISNAANDADIKVYNCGASGDAATTNIVDWVESDTSLEGNGITKHSMMPEPVRCANGIFVDITGTNAAAIVYYKIVH